MQPFMEQSRGNLGSEVTGQVKFQGQIKNGGKKTFLSGEYICICTFLSSHSPIRNLQSFTYPGLKKKMNP